MEVQFEANVQAELERLARESGRAAAELVQDAVAGYVGELADTRDMLNSRYDEIHGGKVKLIHGDEVFARLREKRRGTARHITDSSPCQSSLHFATLWSYRQS